MVEPHAIALSEVTASGVTVVTRTDDTGTEGRRLRALYLLTPTALQFSDFES